MDAGLASIFVAGITTSGLLGVAFINAMNDREKATYRDQITRLKALIRILGGNPDDA